MAAKSSRFISGFGFQVLAAMVVGLGLGLLARSLGDEVGERGWWLAETLRQVGAIFIQLLRVLVPPLVFTAIVASVVSLRDLKGAAGLVWRTLLWFAITALIAVVIGLALGLILQPGHHAGVSETLAAKPKSQGGWLDFLTGLVPVNIFGLSASTTITDGAAKTGLSFNVLQIVFLGLVVGVAALFV
ncbi:cation:dicarboxylase symporter family transporter, partial [Caulobacter sp. SLTY]|uniref:dicarboxylate/amino acid:cation symporter n=1 Tax=Caulobacter sp. SLTY TaxID=2683262 RepID=UPI0014135428